MRLLKFRVWDANNEVMWYEDDVCTHADIWNLGTNKEQFSNNKIMQFTGCYDRNGKEIWEGDIIKYVNNDGYNVIGVVEWLEDEGCWYLNSFPLWEQTEKEVIGDINHNPELMETK